MELDPEQLRKFEENLDPQNPARSRIPAEIIGYGEISSIFWVPGLGRLALKRLPLFKDRPSAEVYAQQYQEYCRLLTEAGLILPDSLTGIVEVPGRPVILYVAQVLLPTDRVCHRLIHECPAGEIETLLERITREIAKVWQFNQSRRPTERLALDGQLSNWAVIENGSADKLVYLDTSTPIYQIDGVERMDPELFLQAAPSFARWLLRLLFVKDVLDRYYRPRQVYIDLVANLYKEQRPELVPLAVDVVNRHFTDDRGQLTVEEVDKYYREDKRIWTWFLALRRLDRCLTTRLFGRRYEFILPGKIKR